MKNKFTKFAFITLAISLILFLIEVIKLLILKELYEVKFPTWNLVLAPLFSLASIVLVIKGLIDYKKDNSIGGKILSIIILVLAILFTILFSMILHGSAVYTPFFVCCLPEGLLR